MYVQPLFFIFKNMNLPEKGDLKREYNMIKQTEEVCVYLWDNYIE